MQLGARDLAWIVTQATWPVAVWGVSFFCMLDEEPEWLMSLLNTAVLRTLLPQVLYDHLFLAEAHDVLQPIARQVEIIMAYERSRLSTSRLWVGWQLQHSGGRRNPPHTSGHMHALKKSREQLEDLLLKGRESTDKSVSASEVKPVLTQLLATINSIELAIEAQVAALDERPIWGRWVGLASGEARALGDELESVHYLRRCVLALPVMPSHAMPHRRDSGSLDEHTAAVVHPPLEYLARTAPARRHAGTGEPGASFSPYVFPRRPAVSHVRPTPMAGPGSATEMRSCTAQLRANKPLILMPDCPGENGSDRD
eukprot:CAMPEP_0119430610 /NCGR_PEP_ID=MMETSP1335-20130426/44429_1 /TAXON_ID=259385 /ORGANISM="Chrysoculter rhomboideus, Strain RCC1486" /LENGTH=311 /DNA_ID=CAMNT_0007456371 /DNA_START=45 /DNA_END=979 /DNA_ORIENTATION=-